MIMWGWYAFEIAYQTHLMARLGRNNLLGIDILQLQINQRGLLHVMTRY